MNSATNVRAFRKGLAVLDMEIDAIKRKRMALRADLMEALEINNRVSFCHYADGKTKLDKAVAIRVTNVFKKYGIDNPWGFPEDEDVN